MLSCVLNPCQRRSATLVCCNSVSPEIHHQGTVGLCYASGHNGNGLFAIRLCPAFLVCWLRPPVQDLDMALVVVHVIGLFLTQFPALVTPRSLDLWYMLLQGLLVAPFFFVNLPPNAIALSNWTFVLRVMFGISARRGYLAVLVNAVVSLQVMRIVGYSFTNQFFTGEVTKLTFYILLVFAVRRLIFRDSKASVELKSRSIELEAVSALLRGFCDAVVEVDQSLHITENSNQLLTLLLRSSNQACLSGKDFIELFCSDDQQQVRECLTKFSDTHTHALNARLLDADGNHVKIELLHIRFLSATGDLHRNLADESRCHSCERSFLLCHCI